ncbi:uncharacterized protein TM35_000302100 [Trypanosoma theileri]|uniref:Uncharacterized protein n=1 Tax=Trypanosoma theileri TaxID=67003 RepID=A0A1X0NPV9_9TRYP|nr:uncharacterized protein TM35_000302100 [Trypanosoma theileri]ORC86170.1 hypothetical protein TM35_000302100 [Trypanosoma theileri]
MFYPLVRRRGGLPGLGGEGFAERPARGPHGDRRQRTLTSLFGFGLLGRFCGRGVIFGGGSAILRVSSALGGAVGRGAVCRKGGSGDLPKAGRQGNGLARARPFGSMLSMEKNRCFAFWGPRANLSGFFRHFCLVVAWKLTPCFLSRRSQGERNNNKKKTGDRCGVFYFHLLFKYVSL